MFFPFFQTAGVVSGLPYTFIICILCVALWRAVKVAAGDLDAFGPTFAVGLFDCLFAQPLKTIRSESSKVLKLFMKFLSNIVLAPYTIGQVSARLSNSRRPMLHCIVPIMSFALFIIFHLAEIGKQHVFKKYDHFMTLNTGCFWNVFHVLYDISSVYLEC